MSEQKEVEMFVAGLVLDPGTNAPIVILKDASGDICLPIWIGVAEANAIAAALKRQEIIRPMTHDLLRQIVEELNARVIKIFIRGLEQNTFFADILIAQGDRMRTLDARPSDALALAVRVGAPITVAQSVLDQAQVTLVSVNSQELEEVEVDPAKELEVESTNFANIDKDKWEEILAEMDPDDFKYKM